MRVIQLSLVKESARVLQNYINIKQTTGITPIFIRHLRIYNTRYSMYLIFSNCTHLKEFSQYTAVSRKVVLQTGKSLATMSKVIMGNGDFYSCLSPAQGVSAWWRETAQTRVFLLPFSLLLNHFEPQSSRPKLLLPIMLIGIVAYAFTVLWDNLRRNSCICGIFIHEL